MTSHPNRSKRKGPASNPAPSAIIAAREASGLTVQQCAALVYSTATQWAAWEAGERRMHPAIWQTFNAKVAKQ